MQRIIRSALFLAAIMLLAACVTGPRVSTEVDAEADFSQYHTWGWYQPLAMEQSGYSSPLTSRIKSTIEREMQARGYTMTSTSPDLLVNFQGVVQERTDVYSMPRSDIQYYYSYRHRSYVGFPVWYDETRVNTYRQGTLSVDLVDARRNHMVWTGDAIGRVTKKDVQERLLEADEAVREIFARYPYRAGSAVPVGDAP